MERDQQHFMDRHGKLADVLELSGRLFHHERSVYIESRAARAEIPGHRLTGKGAEQSARGNPAELASDFAWMALGLEEADPRGPCLAHVHQTIHQRLQQRLRRD